MKKSDKCLLAGILILSLIGLLTVYILTGNNGDTVCVRLRGELLGEYALTQNREIPVKTEQGINIIVIENGRVFMEEADCPDQYCVQHAAISNANQTIVCLPHQLVVEVTAESEFSQKTDLPMVDGYTE